jgi:hypothetical protein
MLSEKPWKLEAVLRLVLGIMACMCLAVLAAQLLFPGTSTGGGQFRFPEFLAGTAALYGATIVLVRYFLVEHAIGWREAFGFSTAGLSRTALIAAGSIVLFLPAAWVLGQLVALAMEAAHQKPVVQQTVQALQVTVSLPERIYFGVIVIAVAPVVEEILFRGIIYPTWKQHGRPRAAVWGTSLIFALVHANTMTFLPLTLLAVLLTELYERTNNLLVPIFAHSLFNAANFLWIVGERELTRLLSSAT